MCLLIALDCFITYLTQYTQPPIAFFFFSPKPRPGSNAFIRPGTDSNYFEYSKRAIQPLDNDMKQSSTTSVSTSSTLHHHDSHHTTTALAHRKQQQQRGGGGGGGSLIQQRLKRDTGHFLAMAGRPQQPQPSASSSGSGSGQQRNTSTKNKKQKV